MINSELTNNVYSSTEQRVGTWIDGKPLYRKIINTTTPVTTTDGVYVNETTNLNINNIDKCFVEFGFFYTTNGNFLFLPSIDNNSNNLRVTIVNKTKLRLYNGVAIYSALPCIISLLYTKTTD